MKNILIAGGTGLVGKKLVQKLKNEGHSVAVLSRNPRSSGAFFWDPAHGKVDKKCLQQTTVLINLSGAGIADNRWTTSRKRELAESRIGTNHFLLELLEEMPNLTHFICASGINAYGFDSPEKTYVESDEFGSDYLSGLVKDWENSADLFAPFCKVAKVRTAVVLSETGGALGKMTPLFKRGFGSVIGSGDQSMPWIHVDDLVRMFAHIVTEELSGSYHAVSESCSNRIFSHTLADVLNKRIFLPAVPSFLLQIVLGEMAIILLKGVKASNQKIISTGFVFQYKSLSDALGQLLGKSR
jgi:uncharacterized protein (TIGR01777 family)